MSSLVLFLSLISLSLISAAPQPARTPVCALQTSSSATLVKTAESANSYQLSFKWTQDAPVDYVDYHYRINNEQFVNIRAYDGSTPAHQATHALELSPGDVLHAMVTYSVNGVGCDVAITETTAPSLLRPRAPASRATSTPAVIPPSHIPSESTTQAIQPHATLLSCDHITQQLVHDPTLGYNIYATLIPGSEWIDSHYSVGNTPYNYRMIPTPTTNVMTLPKPIQVAAGTPISYYFTFGSSTNQGCDSGRFTTGETTAQVTAPIPIPVQQPAPVVEAQPEIIPLTQAPMTTPTETAAPVQEQVPAPVPAPVEAQPAPSAAATEPIVTPVGAAEAAAEPPCAAGNIIHQVASDNERNYVVTFNTAPGDAPFDAVSVYTLVGNDEKTTPMGTNVATGQTPPIHVPEGQSLIYYVTYSRGGIECKTAFFST